MTAYDQDNIISQCQEALKQPQEFYKSTFVNYRGKTKNVRYTEIVAQFLLDHIDVFKDGIPMITRQSSYKIASHNNIATMSSEIMTNRIEERLAKEFVITKKQVPKGSPAIAYQVPLKDTNGDKGMGKIDLISHNPDTNILYIFELKRPDSKETLLRSVLEIYTYWKTVNKIKLAENLIEKQAVVIPSVLVFQNSFAHQDYKDKSQVKLRKLMEALNVQITLLRDSYEAIDL